MAWRSALLRGLAVVAALSIASGAAMSGVGVPSGISSPSTTPFAPVAPEPDPRVEVVKAVTWPLVVFVLALVFRAPVARFLSAAGGRMTRLSIFNVAVEMAPVSGAPVLNEIRQLTDPAAVGDSSRALAEQVQKASQAEFAVVDLGPVTNGLRRDSSSRLY
jgi:hypothetical protein